MGTSTEPTEPRRRGAAAVAEGDASVGARLPIGRCQLGAVGSISGETWRGENQVARTVVLLQRVFQAMVVTL